MSTHENTAAELARQFNRDPNHISLWKKQLLGSAGKVFGSGADSKAEGKKYVKESEIEKILASRVLRGK